MNSRALGIAAIAVLALFVGFAAGTFLATDESAAPSFAPIGGDERPVAENAASPGVRSAPLSRAVARVASASPVEYQVTEADLERARSGVDVAGGTAPRGTARITGRIVTQLGEPLEEVVVIATLRRDADPHGEFSDDLGDGRPDDLTLDESLARQAQTWARTHGGRFRGVTAADGRYAIERLPAGRYRLSAFKAGHLFDSANSGWVESGGTQDFTAQPVVVLDVDVRMPDGKAPPLAAIRVTGDRGAIRWTPERRVIRIADGEGSIQAFADFVTGVGYGTQAPARLRSELARLSDGQREVELRLEPQIGIYGRVLGESRMHPRGVTLLDLSRDPTVSAEAFAASLRRTDLTGDVFEFLGLTPGPYAIGLLDHQDALLASATVNVGDALVEQHLEIAPPDPEHAIRVLCLNPAGRPLSDVQLRYAIVSEQGSRSGSLRRTTRDSRGAWLIPLSALRGLSEHGEDAVVRFTATHSRYGSCFGDLKRGARELTLQFAEPCELRVTVPGYTQSAYRGSLKVRARVEQEKSTNHEFAMLGGMSSQSQTAQILDDDAAVFPKLAPGDWVVQLIFEAPGRPSGAIAEARIALRAASQQLSLPIPPLYDLVVQAPTLEPRTHLWIRKISADEKDMWRGGTFQASMQLDEQRQAILSGLPAGRYQVHANGASKPLDVTVPGGPYVLSAPVIDCVRVAISDQEGVLHRAGLRPGDLVTSIDGVPLTAGTWWRVLSEQGRKKGVPLTLIRDGRTMTLQGGDHVWHGDDVGGSYAPASRDDGS